MSEFRKLPVASLVAGLVLYLVDTHIGGVIPHINATVHESGHWIAGAASGVSVNRLSIGASGAVMLRFVVFAGTEVTIFWQAFSSSINMTGETFSAIVGGPLSSMVWGAMLTFVAKRLAKLQGKVVVAATIVVALTAVDSFVARGVFNLMPTSLQSDGYRILQMTRD